MVRCHYGTDHPEAINASTYISSILGSTIQWLLPWAIGAVVL
jgi:hypothetical protein